MSREIRLNAFEMNCIGHQLPGLWRRPVDRSADYHTLEYRPTSPGSWSAAGSAGTSWPPIWTAPPRARAVSEEAALVLFSGWTGIDLARFRPDEVVEHVRTEAGHSALEGVTLADPAKRVGEVARWGGIGPVRRAHHPV